MNEYPVVMTLEEHTSLVTAVERYNLLVDALFDAAALDYSGRKLTIYSDTFDTIMKICMNDTYIARLHELQEKEVKNESDQG